jgi:hypothetical protein
MLVKLPKGVYSPWVFNPEDVVRGNFVGPVRVDRVSVLVRDRGRLFSKTPISVLRKTNPVLEGRLTFN